jgi:hypothetical protein
VSGVPGCGEAYKGPSGLLGVWATHGKACTAWTRGGGGAALLSPGWRRRGGRDDMRAPPVSDSGRGRAGRRRLRTEGQLGREQRWAAALGGLRGCWAGLAGLRRGGTAAGLA